MLLLTVLYTRRKEGVTLHLEGALCCCPCFTQEGRRGRLYTYREPYAAVCALHRKENFTGSPMLLSVLYTGRRTLQGALCCCLCFTQEGELYREPYAALCALHKKEGGEDFTGSPMLLSVLYTGRTLQGALCCSLCFTQEGGRGRFYREPYAALCALHKKEGVGDFTLTGSPMLLSALHKKGRVGDFTLTGSPILLSGLYTRRRERVTLCLQGALCCCL